MSQPATGVGNPNVHYSGQSKVENGGPAFDVNTAAGYQGVGRSIAAEAIPFAKGTANSQATAGGSQSVQTVQNQYYVFSNPA